MVATRLRRGSGIAEIQLRVVVLRVTFGGTVARIAAAVATHEARASIPTTSATATTAPATAA